MNAKERTNVSISHHYTDCACHADQLQETHKDHLINISQSRKTIFRPWENASRIDQLITWILRET